MPTNRSATLGLVGLGSSLLAALLGILSFLRGDSPLFAAAGFVAAVLLMIAGVVLSVLALATRRGSSRALIFGVSGLSIGVLLLLGGAGAGMWRAMRAAQNGVSERETIVDKDYCFKLAWPGQGWRLLREKDVKRLVPHATAGAMAKGGRYGTVSVEHLPGMKLEPIARAAIANMTLEQKRTRSFKRVRFKGRDAVRYVVTGTIKGVEIRFVSVVFVRQSYAFHLLSWGTTSVDADSLKPFFDAFTPTEGTIHPRLARQDKAVASRGVGWRVRQGVFESAAFGIRVRPKAGWRLAIGSELDGLNRDAEVGLLRHSPDVSVVLVAERAGGVDPKAFAAMQQTTALGQMTPLPQVPVPAASLSGQRMNLKRARDPTGIELLYGVLFHGDVCLQLVYSYPERVRQQAEASLPGALAAVALLDQRETDGLRRQMAKEPFSQQSIAPSAVLRGGVFRDFETRLVWRKPPGLWRVSIGEAARAANRDASLLLEHPSTGIQALVIVEPLAGRAPSGFHDQVRAMLWPTKKTGRPVQLSVAGGLALSSTGKNIVGGLTFEKQVVTTTRGERAFQILFWGLPGNMARAKQAVRQAIAGFTFLSPGVRPSTLTGNHLRDLRLGFEFRPPDARWHSSDLTPPAQRQISRNMIWRSPDGEVGVVAVFNIGDDAKSLESLVERILGQSRPGLVFGNAARGEATLDGRPCRHLTWSGLKHTEAYLLTRGSFLYAVLVNVSRSVESSRLVAGFQLLQ